jgi:hypothetical protein
MAKKNYHHGKEGRGIFTIGKCGAKFKILKCLKQTLSPFPQQSTLQNGVITQNNFLFKRLMAVSRLLYSIASYVHFKVGNNRASPFLFMEKMVDQILLNYANIMMMMGASMPKVIFYCCYTNLGHVFFKRKSRHWTYHFLFDILSYHIICRKNNIKSFISYR